MAAAAAEYFPASTAEHAESASPTPAAVSTNQLKQNLLKTANLCLLFTLVGMSDASLGAALPGLTCLARTSEQKATLLLFAHEIGVLLMAVCSGMLSRRLSANLVLTTVSLLVPTCFVMVTFCSSLESMVVIFSLMGTMEGCLEYFCNVQMIFLYKSKSGPFLQAMFFCQSLGAFVAPLLIGSFMANPHNREWSNCSLPEELQANAFQTFSQTEAQNSDRELQETLGRVKTPFYVIAVIQLPIMFSMLFLSYKEGWKTEVKRQETSSADSSVNEVREEGPSAMLVLLLASCCAFALDGILGSYSSLIYTFSIKSVHVSSSSTAYLSATFWGSTLIGRFVGIPLTLKLSTVHLIFIDLAGLFIAAILFMIGQHSLPLLFTSTVLTGFFISHCMPAILALTEQFILVTRDRGTSLVASAAFGEAVVPVAMAAVMHKIGRSAYPVFHSLFVLISGVLCFFLINFGFRTKKSEFGKESGLTTFVLFGIFSRLDNDKADYKMAQSGIEMHQQAAASRSPNPIDDDEDPFAELAARHA